ncbi:MAG: AAA family ATPase [Gammaproteobacteria bacterium]|nr:AAA family ATPase [Gammaproteobacteria bacterium]
MYTSFFGLTEKPFAITPDPRYLYLSERHAEALAHLAYGIKESGGFIQLTGEVGTGKTTVLRSLLQQLPPNCDVALILNPRITAPEFLAAICDELNVTVLDRARGSVKELVDLLSGRLLESHSRGRRVVLMVDEAQNLSPDVLEQVRLLTNLETATQKLLQIILIGQPELRVVLSSNELRQLAQRITGRYHLEALTRAESEAYIRHRLRVAGATADIFTRGALAEIHRLAGGIPRIMNVISDRALLGAYSREEHRIGADLVRTAASEVYGRPVAAPWLRWVAVAAAAAGVAGLVWAGWLWSEREPAAATAAASTPVVAATKAASAPAAPAASTPAAAPINADNLAALLATHAADTTTEAAFTRLFKLWSASFDAASVSRPCDQASAQGLACVASRGTIAQLKLINRPAILSLIDGNGAEHQVVVSGLEGDRVRLELPQGAKAIPLTDLADLWFGEFLVLWRPQVTMARELRSGMRGEDVRWLRRGLERLGGLPARSVDDDLFDAELTRLVQDFQRRHRLSVDGIAGVQTQVALDASLGAPGTPLLAAPAAPVTAAAGQGDAP